VAAAVAVPASKIDLSSARTDASWKAGLVYKPEPSGTLYASYDTSVRPPGTSAYTNTLSTTTTSADDPVLEPERAVNCEAGVKWEFLDDHLLASAAAFRSVNSNVPAADPVSGIVNQSSDQTVEGVEFGLAGNITKEWMVFAGYAHMHAQVSAEISTNAQGLTLPLLPSDSGSLWTTYALPHGVTLGGGVQYMGPTERLQATNAPAATTFSNGVPDYWLLGAMVSWQADRHLTLRLNVNNIADRTYVASLNNNGYRLNLGTPRTVMLSAELKY
jgi:catecholate siderophore receptor